ncbi:MAG: hypothetical protein R3C43_07005 [Chloroflexota bacterium]
MTRDFTAGDAALTGRMSACDVYKAGGTLVARTDNTWGMLDADNNGIDPTRVAVLQKQVQKDYRGATISARTDYKYDLYDNQTEAQEYGERTGTTPWRTLEYKYAVNTAVNSNKWLVNLAWRETLWDGLPNESQSSKIVRRTRYRYDGATCNTPNTAPTNGLLTAED